MTQRLMGVETEYAFTAFQKDGSVADPDRAMKQIERIAEHRLPHLPVRADRGIFLQNASRFYRDCGGNNAHQEMATPECPNPWDAVRYIVANEEILLGLSDELLRKDSSLGEALYFKHNVDYGGGETSWGLHESYLTRSPLRSLPEHLLPHLVSRIIYTGAGGFNPFSRGIEFMVSPRVAHITCTVSNDTQGDRPIFNTRNEPLAKRGYRRLHVICGDSLSSHTGMWLRSATTALVVALADGGVKPGNKVALADPVKAMHTFARDPFCTVKVILHNRKLATAVEIQRHYLELAETHLEKNFMPPWAPQVCRHWREILDRLEKGAPDSVATVLDWAIKYSLFANHTARRNLKWETVRRGRKSANAVGLRQELFEIDIRFGQLGDRGIFAGLDRAGVLQHRFPGVDNFSHAIIHPPDSGRALLRGRAIKNLAGKHPRIHCDWHGVWDRSGRRWLDLSHPFENSEEWKPFENDPTDNIRTRDHLEPELDEIDNIYHDGRYETASIMIRELERMSRFFSERTHARLVTLKSLVQSRRGFLDGVDLLDSIQNAQHTNRAKLGDYYLVLRLSGLAPLTAIPEHVLAAFDRCREVAEERLPLPCREHMGICLTREGKLDEAAVILNDAIRGRTVEMPGLNRRRAALANIKRLLEETDESLALLNHAREAQLTHGFTGDLTDYTYPNLAKLASAKEPAEARLWLSKAKEIQTPSHNRLGLIRTLLLEARLAAVSNEPAHGNDGILALADEVPAMATCRLYKKIMDRWTAWSGDPDAAEHGDVFWGL